MAHFPRPDRIAPRSRPGRLPRRRSAAPPLAAIVIVAAATAARGDVLRLRSGAVVQGTVIKRNDQRVWLDLGPEVIEFRVEDVDEVKIEHVESKVQMRKESLFRVAKNLPELDPMEQARRIGASVIKVSTPNGLGSGVMINPEGFAVTNAHVIQGETELRATVWLPQADGTLKRETLEDIEIVAVNSHLDLALLRIDHPEKGGAFRSAALEATENLQVGQVVFAIGNPLGLERTLSQGVVSTTQRSFDGLTYVQTDAAINPGNSGGPLFNTKGEVIGITNMGILGGEALGFAIPARYVKDFIRHREAFAFDQRNPNSGHHYHQPPPRERFGVAPALLDGTSASNPAPNRP